MLIAQKLGERVGRKVSHSIKGSCLFLLSLLGSYLVPFVCLPPSALAQDIPRYGVFEVTLTASGSYANPYLMMPGDNNTPGFVRGSFMGPNGESISIDGFWDGGTTWKIRMAPTAVGVWTYTTSSADAGLDGVSGSFNCVPSNSKGFIRVDPAHPHHFMWEDGTPLYWAPVTTMIAHFASNPSSSGWDAIGGARQLDDGSFQALAALRAAQGFNATHWGYYGFNKPFFNRKEQQNEGGAPFSNYDPDLLNPSYHQFGDQRVAALLAEGIFPMFNLGWPDQGIASTIGHTRLKRYWRYLIARYAAYNVNWNIFGEANEFGDFSVAEDYGALTKTWDPYGHLTTTHLTGGPPSSWASQAWYDYVMLQTSSDSTSSFLSFGKPVVNVEYGGYEDFQVSGEALRPLVWNVRMHGGYFVYESWGNDPSSVGAQYASLANLFFRDRTRFWLLEYHPELFNGASGLADPGNEYVMYLSSGGSITVDLSAVSGSLPVEWYNPRTGELVGQTTVAGGGSTVFAAPDGNDWVLHIGNVGTASPPQASFSASPLSGMAPLTVSFDGSASSDPNGGSISSYAWDFGDGSSGSGATVSHVFGSSGSFVVVLTVTNDNGVTGTTQQTVVVSEPSVPTTLTVTPTSLSVKPDGTQQFTASLLDQNGIPLTGTITWSATAGTITQGGLYTAPSIPGSYTVQAQHSTLSASGTVVVDGQGPTLVSAKTLSQGLVEIQFSEPVNVGTVALVANYSIHDNLGNALAVLDTTDSVAQAAVGKVHLLTAPHVDGDSYTLSVSNVTDLAGNPVAGNSTVSYTYTASSPPPDNLAPLPPSNLHVVP